FSLRKNTQKTQVQEIINQLEKEKSLRKNQVQEQIKSKFQANQLLISNFQQNEGSIDIQQQEKSIKLKKIMSTYESIIEQRIQNKRCSTQIDENIDQCNQSIEKPQYPFKYNSQSFIFIKSLGKGSHSEVFLAQDKYTGFLFAVKKLNIQKLIEMEMEEQFSCEIKIQYFLNQPNIIKLFYFFKQGNFFYLIMEYAQGNQLSRVQKQNTFLKEPQAAFYLLQISQAISYLHKINIMHRDIKTENIIITNEIAKLADFGYSRKSNQQNIRNTFCGTLDYLSPEIINGQNYDIYVDIWAFGVLTYQLLQGVAPFYEESQSETLDKIKEGKFMFQKWISDKAQYFVKSLLIINSEKRPSVKEILHNNWLLEQAQVYENQLKSYDDLEQELKQLY
ncbi:protein kinase domain protein, partial [Ichthyophthirius multifiliis]